MFKCFVLHTMRRLTEAKVCPSMDEKCWKTKFVFARVCRKERHQGRCKNTTALQDKPSLPRSDIYSGPERGSMWRGLPCECVLVTLCVWGFPPRRRKAPLIISCCFCPCVDCGPGSGGKLWDFPQVRNCERAFACRPCLCRSVWRVIHAQLRGEIFFRAAELQKADGWSSVGPVLEKAVPELQWITVSGCLGRPGWGPLTYSFKVEALVGVYIGTTS